MGKHFKEPEKMDKDINTSIRQYLNLIKEKYANIESVYLFGSYAKGKFTKDRDIDLALIFKTLNDSERFDIQVQLMILASKVDSRIEPHPISYDDFITGNPFVAEIKKTGVVVAA
jgi:predicted nucleotidyltransferase